MNRRLVLLVALVGSIASLHATGASAGEFEMHCEGAAVCQGTVQGTGEFHIGESGGIKVICISMGGTTTLNSTTSTGTAQLLFHGCKLNVFGGGCTTNATPGTITTNVMTTHLIYIDPLKTTPGILFTGANVTFFCSNGWAQTITGNFIGHIENPECSVSRTNHTVAFENVAPGQPRFTQVTTTGAIHDLIASGHGGSSPQTTTFIGTWHTTYAAGTTARLTC